MMPKDLLKFLEKGVNGKEDIKKFLAKKDTLKETLYSAVASFAQPYYGTAINEQAMPSPNSYTWVTATSTTGL